MSRRVMFNTVYERLRGEVMALVDDFEHAGEVIYRGHNIIRVAHAGDLEVNIKRYRVPNVLNRFVYSYIRKPKGERAFTYPAVLKAAGIATPEPVAYIEDRRFGFIAYSYLVTVQEHLAHDFYEFGNKTMDNPDDVAVIKALARFSARMHQAGILHRDFSPGNILFDFDSEHRPVFSVVDINRMSIGDKPVDVITGVTNMARLWGQPVMFDILADEYAAARGAGADVCRAWLHRARKKFWTRYARRHRIKYNLRFT